jgi:chromosome segregation ATPase
MEAIMDNFDYGVMTKAGKMQVVKRNDQTSFLSKYLRSFGGPGVYNDLRIGRVLRDFRFVGMGNVDNPANSNSKYTKIEAVSKNDVYDSIDNTFITNTVIVTAKGTVMKLENMEQALAYIEELNKQIETATASTKTSADEIASLKEQVAGLSGQKDASEASLKTATEALAAANTALETATKELEATKADLAEKNKVLDEIRAAEKLAARVKAASEINIAVDEAKQQQIAKMSDAEFESYMLGAKEVKAATESKTETTTTEDVTKASAEAEKTIAEAKEEKTETAEDVAAATAGESVQAAEDKIKATASALASVIRSSRTRTVKITKQKNATK